MKSKYDWEESDLTIIRIANSGKESAKPSENTEKNNENKKEEQK